MNRVCALLSIVIASLLLLPLSASAKAQQDTTPAAVAVPHLVNFNGTTAEAQPGVPVTLKFSLYETQTGGEAIWSETQQVTPDNKGRYAVLLGATTEGGLPQAAFNSAQAKWLGVVADNGAEQPRIILVATPYSLKASDAETLGGHPVSDFKLEANTGGKPETAVDVTSITAGTGITVSNNGTASPTVAINANYLDTLAAGFPTLSGNNKFTGTNTLANTTVNGTLTVSGTINSTYLNSIAATLPTLKGNNTFSGATTFDSTVTVTGAAADQLSSKTSAASGVAINAQATGNDGLGINAVAQGANGIGIGGTGNQTNGIGVVGSGFQGMVGTGGTTFSVNANTGLPVISTSGIGASISGGIGLNAVSTDPNSAGIGVIGTGGPAEMVTSGNIYYYGIGVEGSGFVGVEATSPSDGIGLLATSTSGLGVAGSGPDGGAFLGTCCSYSFEDGGQGVFGEALTGVEGFGSGLSQGTGQYFTTWGVIGSTPYTVEGSQGVASYSTTGADFATSSSAGVWGDSPTSGTAGSGMLATADTNTALIAVNDSSNSTLEIYNYTSGTAAGDLMFETLSPCAYSSPACTGPSGGNGTSRCTIDTSGNLTCTGQLTHDVILDGDKHAAMYAMSSPENWQEDFGSSTLSAGVAHVSLDPRFGETVNTGVEYHVFLTPNGDCKGLYVSAKSAGGFEVRELGGGKSSVAFDYRIVAKRKGYENVRMADLTPLAEKVKAEVAKRAQLSVNTKPDVHTRPHAEEMLRKFHPQAPTQPPLRGQSPRTQAAPAPVAARAANEVPQR